MQTIEKLPDAPAIIGTREVVRKIKSGDVKRVIVAKNCPVVLLKRFDSVTIEQFNGDEKDLATKLGKPFPIAVVGYKE